MAVRTVYEDAYASVTYDPDRKLVCYRRHATPYPDHATALDAIVRARSSMPVELTLAHHVFLMDVREGPLRTDDGFEQVVRDAGPELSHRFKRSAILVKTAVGALQMKRLLRERGGRSEVFDDEEKAIAYLLR